MCCHIIFGTMCIYLLVCKPTLECFQICSAALKVFGSAFLLHHNKHSSSRIGDAVFISNFPLAVEELAPHWQSVPCAWVLLIFCPVLIETTLLSSCPAARCRVGSNGSHCVRVWSGAWDLSAWDLNKFSIRSDLWRSHTELETKEKDSRRRLDFLTMKKKSQLNNLASIVAEVYLTFITQLLKKKKLEKLCCLHQFTLSWDTTWLYLLTMRH